MRVRRRDVKPGLTFFQCAGSEMQTLRSMGCEKESSFVLVRPLRVDDDGTVETLTFLEEVSPKDTQSDCLYVEVEEEMLHLSAADRVNDDADYAKYLYMGKQQWIVYDVKDPKHNFRKSVSFLLGKTFEAECDKKDKVDRQKEEKGLPIPKSISFEDYQRKDKRINKNFKNDDFNSIY